MRHKIRKKDYLLGGSVIYRGRINSNHLLQEKATYLRKLKKSINNSSGAQKRILEMEYYNIESEELKKEGFLLIRKIYEKKNNPDAILEDLEKDFFDLKVKDLILQE